MAKVLLHHPKIRAEIRRNRKQADILIEHSGWREGPLPPKQEPAAVTPAGQEEPASAAPAKKAASTSKNEGK